MTNRSGAGDASTSVSAAVPEPNSSGEREPSVVSTALERIDNCFELTRMDAIDWLVQLPSESVDLIITDPPYESLEKHRARGTTTRLKVSKASSNEWFQIFPNARFEELLIQLWRVLKWNSHFYLFCDVETMFYLKPRAESVGFRFWKPLVWDKQVMGMGYHYRARYEFILFFEKGKRKLHNLGIPDVLTFKRVLRGYPTEKPSGLIEVLIQQSTEEGAVVVDPFAGSGAVGVAAMHQRRYFKGNDISAASLELMSKRLVQARAGLNLG